MGKKKYTPHIWKEILLDRYDNNPTVWFEKNLKNNTKKILYAEDWCDKFELEWEDLLATCNELEKIGYLRCPHTREGGIIQTDINKPKHIFNLTKEGATIAAQIAKDRTYNRDKLFMIVINALLVILTFFMVTAMFMQVSENSKLTELTKEQLIKQCEPQVYIEIETPKKPWVYDPVNSYLSPFIELSLSDRYHTDYSNKTIR